MVNNPNLRILAATDCQIVPTPDANGDVRQKIVNGPVYELAEAKNESARRKFFFVTDKAATNQFDLDMGATKLRPFVAALTRQSHARGSERCQTSASITPPVSWEVDCDAYAMRWNSYYEQEFGDADEYYLKFGFKDDDPRFLVVSIKT